jgi:hypothetical protein
VSALVISKERNWFPGMKNVMALLQFLFLIIISWLCLYGKNQRANPCPLPSLALYVLFIAFSGIK